MAPSAKAARRSGLQLSTTCPSVRRSRTIWSSVPRRSTRCATPDQSKIKPVRKAKPRMVVLLAKMQNRAVIDLRPEIACQQPKHQQAIGVEANTRQRHDGFAEVQWEQAAQALQLDRAFEEGRPYPWRQVVDPTQVASPGIFPKDLIG